MQNHGEMIGIQAKQRHQRSHCSFPDFGAFGFVSPGNDFSQSHFLFSCNFKKKILIKSETEGNIAIKSDNYGTVVIR